jgi:hypothetical protein
VKKRGGEFGDKKKGEILNYGHEKERAWQVMDSHRQVFIFWTDCIVFMKKKRNLFRILLCFFPLFLHFDIDISAVTFCFCTWVSVSRFLLL